MNDTFLDEARQQAAQCWCREDTRGITMDPRLAEAVARCIAAWMDTAAFHLNGEQYYRGLLVRCGEALGQPAKTCDDGSLVPEVLVAKVAELVEAAAKQRDDLLAAMRAIEESCDRPSSTWETAKSALLKLAQL